MALGGRSLAGDPEDHAVARLDDDASKTDIQLAKRRNGKARKERRKPPLDVCQF
jgi:hypothetical protein